MAHTVFLHPGTPKSGTTSVQDFLVGNRTGLEQRDQLLFPGRTWVDQVDAARALLRLDREHLDAAPAWDLLAAEVRRWPGSAVISMEWLSSSGVHGMQHMVRSLAPAKVHCIITVRDLGRTIPAAWQEFVQNREAWTWAQFLDDISREDPEVTAAGRLFWDQQDIARQVADWTSVLPTEQVHLVTLPHPGAPGDLLLRRFTEVVGVRLDDHDLPPRSNESLGLESAVLMQRVNQTLGRDLDVGAYNANVKHLLAKEYLAVRKPQESSLVLPESHRPWAAAASERLVRAVRDSGIDVVGDLADLAPSYREDGVQPEDVATETVLGAAVHGLAEMARSRAALAGRLNRAEDAACATTADVPLLRRVARRVRAGLAAARRGVRP